MIFGEGERDGERVRWRVCWRVVKRANAASRAFNEIIIKKINVDEMRMRSIL